MYYRSVESNPTNTYDAFIDYDTRTTEIIDIFYTYYRDAPIHTYDFIKFYSFYFSYFVEGTCIVFETNIIIRTNVSVWYNDYELKYSISNSLRYSGVIPEITLTELKQDYIYQQTYYARETIFDKYVNALIIASKAMDLRSGENLLVKVEDYPNLLNEKGEKFSRPYIRAQGKRAREQGYGRSSKYYITEFEFKRMN